MVSCKAHNLVPKGVVGSNPTPETFQGLKNSENFYFLLKDFSFEFFNFKFFP